MERYQKIHNHIWRDEKFRQLSEAGRCLYLYLLTSPHSNSIGLYYCPKSYMAADLGWTLKKVSKVLKEVLELTNTQFFENGEILFIEKHLKHDPFSNKNQVKFAIKSLMGLPDNPFFPKLYKAVEEYCQPKSDDDYVKPLREWLRERILEPDSTNTMHLHFNSFQEQNNAVKEESIQKQDDDLNESAQGGGDASLPLKGQTHCALDDNGKKHCPYCQGTGHIKRPNGDLARCLCLMQKAMDAAVR